MARLNKTDLFHVLFDAFLQNTDSVYFAGGNNPYRFSFKDKFVNAFIVNVHFAGAGRSTSDEYRIQCPGHLPATLRNLRRQGDRVFVLGFSADLQAFSAWDPDRFLDRNPEAQRFSVYTRLSVMQEANAKGFSTYTDTNGQKIIMFRPNLLGLYVENATVLHQANDEQLRQTFGIESATSLDQPLLPPIEGERQRTRETRNAYPRNPRFRRDVLRAYSHKCAICGIQLDLVDAAHIVPHSHPEGYDTISNGLALCVLHHRSFDTGLLYVREDYSIQVNLAKVNYLERIDRADGLEQYRQQLRDYLHLPRYNNWLPARNNFIRGNELRGVGLKG